MEIENLDRHYFESLKVSEIYSNLQTLKQLIQNEFNKSDDFNTSIHSVLHRLNKCGHNLYSLEYDSDIYRYREIRVLTIKTAEQMG